MRWKFSAVALMLAAYVTVPWASSAQDLAAEYGPGLVLIRVFSRHDEGAIPLGYGTGWLVSYDGHVITAAHVITGDKKLNWDEVVLRGEIRGKSFPMRVIPGLLAEFPDVGLLKVEWEPTDRAETIFEQFRFDLVPTRTIVSILGFPNPDRLKPSVFTARVSQSGGPMYYGDGPIPHGFSGGPALVVEDGPSVIAVARAMTRDAAGREVQGEHVPARSLKSILDYVKNHGDLREPYPRFLPPRPGPLFRGEEIARVLKELKNGRTVVLLGGSGMEADKVAIEIGFRAWQEWKLLPTNVLYLTASTGSGEAKPLSDILADILRQLGKEYAVRGADFEKRAAIRGLLDDPERRLIILNDVKHEEALQSVLGLRGQVPVLITSSSHFIRTPVDAVLSLVGLPVQECVSLFKHESGLELREQSEESAAVEICRLLGGTSGAMRVVGGMVKQGGMGLPALLREIQRDALLPLDELRTAYETAYKSLPPDHQRLLRVVSVVGGDSFDAKAAVAVSGLSNAEFALKRLTWLSLIEERPTGRFRLNPLMRLFARQKLRQSAEEVPALRAMARYFLEEFGGGTEEFEREWSNILYALNACRELPDNTELVQCVRRGVPRVAPFMKYWGLWVLHQEWVRRWYENAKANGDVMAQRAALGALVEVALKTGNDDEARTHLQEGMALPDPESDLATVGLYYSAARLEFEAAIKAEGSDKQDRFQRARDSLYSGIRIAERLHKRAQTRQLIAHGYHDLGIVDEAEHNLDRAQEHFERSLAIAKAESLVFLFSATSYHLARLTFRKGELEKAAVEFGRALEAGRKARDEEAVAYALAMLGVVAREQKKPDLAEKYFSEAVVAQRRIGSRYLEDTQKLLDEVRVLRRAR